MATQSHLAATLYYPLSRPQFPTSSYYPPSSSPSSSANAHQHPLQDTLAEYRLLFYGTSVAATSH
ncbi:hypothetical protein DFH09DRAFT_1312744 [Mycena vulgaris]|nr:hypothetical protein DFH09DRAFT_1312744 [Mycena vulgaris]